MAAAELVRECDGEANPCRDRGLVCTSDTMAAPAPPPPVSPPTAALARSIGLCKLGTEELLLLLDEPSEPRGCSGRRLPDLLLEDAAEPTPPLLLLPIVPVAVAASFKPPYVRRCRAPLSVPTMTDTIPPLLLPLPLPPADDDAAPNSAPPRFRGTGDDDAAASSNGLLPLVEWASRSDDVDDAKGLVLLPPREDDAAALPPPLEDPDEPDAGDGYTLIDRGEDEGRRSHTESMVAILLRYLWWG